MHDTRPTTSRALPTAGLWLLAAGLLLMGGCFTYQPVEPAASPVGERVRVELTGAGQDNLRARRALPLSRLSGQLVGGTSDDILLRVRLSPERLGYGSDAIVDTIRVPRADIRELGVRTISRDRTMAAAAVTVAVAAGAFALFQARQSSSGSTGGDGDVFTVLPLSTVLQAIGIGR